MIKTTLSAEDLLDYLQSCLTEGFNYPVVHTAIDHQDTLELIYILRELGSGDERCASISLASDDPSIASATPIIEGFIFQEREVFDLFGVHYHNHPDLRRLLLPDGFVGHPLRKTYQDRVGEIK